MNASPTSCRVPRHRRPGFESSARAGRAFRGFTLLELMVVLAIVAILTTLAVPSFTRLVQSNTVSSVVNIFMADMRYARSESIRRGGGVVMCRSDAPEASAPVCNDDSGADEKDWASGWIIFLDVNHDDDKQSDEPLLRVQSRIIAIDTILEGAQAGSTPLRFTATGRLFYPSSAMSLHFGGGDYASAVQRVLCVSAGGHARIAGNGAALCPFDSV